MLKKLKFSIRTLLFLSITLVVAFVVGNEVVDYRSEQIAVAWQFEPECEFTVFDPGTETPEVNNLVVDGSPSIIDYLLFRRNVVLTSEVELIYSGEYGGGISHRQPGVPDTKIQCHERYAVSLFGTNRTFHCSYEIGWTEMDHELWRQRSNVQFSKGMGVVGPSDVFDPFALDTSLIYPDQKVELKFRRRMKNPLLE